jgi:putative ABC transport system permease protein
VLGTSLVDGRSFNVLDVEQSQPVAIVNETFVRAYLGRAAVGRRIRVWEQDGSGTEREIVGVVADMVQVRVEDGRRPALYVPHTQSRLPFMWVVVRSTRDATQLAGELREAGRRFNPIVPAPDIERVSDRIRTARAEPRFQAILFLSFAGVAIGLAAVGLYGTLAHTVGRRTRELGIRMAVGADRNSIFRLVLREGAMVFGAGLLVGIALSMLLTRLLRRFLFGVGPLDVTTFAVTSIVLAAIAGVAMHRPARRATRVDPLRSLRAD